MRLHKIYLILCRKFIQTDMFYRLLFILHFAIYALQLNASDITITQLDNISTSSTLSIVYGWFHNPKNDKWITKENEIKDIDKFTNYYILSFPDKGSSQKYVAIVKEQKVQSFFDLNVYIFDYNVYKDKISMWEEDALIKLPILKHHQVRVKKEEMLTNDLLGISDLSGVLSNPRDNFVIQYKFFSDSTVKFLFYTEQCSSDSCVVTGLDTKEKFLDFYNYIGTNTLYSTFFYKTTIKYFTEFVDSPLNK